MTGPCFNAFDLPKPHIDVLAPLGLRSAARVGPGYQGANVPP